MFPLSQSAPQPINGRQSLQEGRFTLSRSPWRGLGPRASPGGPRGRGIAAQLAALLLPLGAKHETAARIGVDRQMATHAASPGRRAGGRSLWFAVWAMLHTRARGADCLSIRPWEGGKLLGRRRRRCGGGGAAVRLGVGGGREEGRRARSVLPAASLRRKTCASASSASASVAVGLPLLLPASPNLRRGWICISLSSNFQRPSTLTGLMLSHRRQY